MKRKPLTKKEIEHLKKLQSEGMSLMEIAIKKKISFWTIKYHLDEKYKENTKRGNSKRYNNIVKKKQNERY